MKIRYACLAAAGLFFLLGLFGGPGTWSWELWLAVLVIIAAMG